MAEVGREEASPGRDALAERVRALGLALGFDRVGFASAEPGPDTAFLRDWLARGFGGEMAYLSERAEERVDPRRVLPGARTAVAVALRYAGGEADPGPIARYARGEDYHEVMGDRLRALEAGLVALAGDAGRPARTRAYVDTGPVAERALAARAGLGWIGKNACLIDPERGSYLFLGVVLTDVALPADVPEPDHCGSCRACLDACPTDAFAEPGVLDATRCLAYTTIELRGPIPEPLREGQGERVFGCDVCQEVCPWNAKAAARPVADPLGLHQRLGARSPWEGPTLAWLLSLDEAAWRRHTRRSALRRSGHRGLLRNAVVAAGNRGDARLRPQLEALARSDDALLAAHARWALDRVASRS